MSTTPWGPLLDAPNVFVEAILTVDAAATEVRQDAEQRAAQRESNELARRARGAL